MSAADLIALPAALIIIARLLTYRRRRHPARYSRA